MLDKARLHTFDKVFDEKPQLAELVGLGKERVQGDESLLFLTPEGHEVDTPFANLHEGEASAFPPAGLMYGEDIDAQEIFRDAVDGANMTFEEA